MNDTICAFYKIALFLFKNIEGGEAMGGMGWIHDRRAFIWMNGNSFLIIFQK